MWWMTKLHTWNVYDDPSMMLKFNSFSFYWQLRGTNHVLDSFLSIHISSVAQSCLTLCDPMDCSTPGFPVHHQLLGAYSNSCPSSQWCHPTNWSSAVSFSSSLQSFPASGCFPVSQLFESGDQSIGASTSLLPMNTQDWSPSGWTGWISLQSKGLSRVFSNTTVQKYQFFSTQLSLWSNSHISTDYWKRCPTSVVAWWLHSFFFMTFYM